MKILYDHQIFERQKVGGISRYFSEIIRNLPDEVLPAVSISFSDNEYLQRVLPVTIEGALFDPRLEFMKGIEFRGKGRLYQMMRRIRPEAFYSPFERNKQSSIEALKAQDFDIFHPTYYDDYFLDFLGDKPFVLTIHDMIPEIYPEFYTNRDAFRISRNKEKLAKRADQIISVSENTRKDIMEVFGIPETRISVIYHATVTEKPKAGSGMPGKYILYMGDRVAGYKNFLFMLRALSVQLLEDPDLMLLCSGLPFNDLELATIENLKISSRVQSTFISDDDLPAYYQQAVCLIIPSCYEGFGIPVLEAFAHSCPVILSNSAVFREIAADAALYFESKDIQDINLKVKEIQEDLKLRNDLISKGLEVVKRFSWPESARRTLEVYQQVRRS